MSTMSIHPAAWVPFCLVLLGCGGGGGRYGGTWEGTCALEGESWELEMVLEKTGGDPSGEVFVIIDALGYERYYSGLIEGVQDGDELGLDATVTPTEDPEDEGRSLSLELVLDGDELSGDCMADALTGTVTLERQ